MHYIYIFAETLMKTKAFQHFFRQMSLQACRPQSLRLLNVTSRRLKVFHKACLVGLVYRVVGKGEDIRTNLRLKKLSNFLNIAPVFVLPGIVI